MAAARSMQVVRFDWAIKKLLRDKANFSILEGFLTVVTGEKVLIQEILESESNQEDDTDKFNKVDLLVKNDKSELIIIEVQNNKEYDYFQRMLYGTSKVLTEHISRGEPYTEIKKVYSITVAYFDLGQGGDYVYHGKTEFRGIHQNDKLELASKQKELFEKSLVHEIFPEYWIIKADKFNNQVSDKLDEWIYFLKNSEIKDEFTAPGLEEAKEKLLEIYMTEEDHRKYLRFQRRLHDIASEKFTQEVDFKDLLKKTKKEGLEEGIKEGFEQGIEQERKKAEAQQRQTIINSIKLGLDNATISTLLNVEITLVEAIRNEI